MNFLDNSGEKPIYDVFLRNRDFIEKFVNSKGIYDYSHHNGGHSFSFIEDEFDPNSITLIHRFRNIGNQTLIYVADCPVKDRESGENELGVSTETVFLTCKGIHIHRNYDSENPEVNIPWSTIDVVERQDQDKWCFYSKVDGERKLLGNLHQSSLVGGSRNVFTKKWGSIFNEAILASKKQPELATPKKFQTASSITKADVISSKQDIISAYGKLQNLLADTIKDIEYLKGVNSQFNEIQERVAQTLRAKVDEAKEELASSLEHTTWDNLVIAFFGETNAGKSTLIETFRILFDENRTKEDGLIVGDGRHDFTKTYDEYKLSIDGVPFTLIDVPGIEGNEDDFKDVIKTALHKAHCIFYIQGHNKKPDTATAQKIKKYLGDWVKVYSVYNVRGCVSNYDEEDERKISSRRSFITSWERFMPDTLPYRDCWQCHPRPASLMNARI